MNSKPFSDMNSKPFSEKWLEGLLADCGFPKREQVAVAKEISCQLDKLAPVMKVMCAVLGEKYEKPMTIAEINDAFASEYIKNRLHETLSEDDYAEFETIQRDFDYFVHRHEPL